MRKHLRYGEQELTYTLARNAGLTTKIRIHVHPDGSVEVEAPAEADETEIVQALLKRARWVSQQLETNRAARAHACPRQYVSGETHFYLGRRFRLRIQHQPEPMADRVFKNPARKNGSQKTLAAALKPTAPGHAVLRAGRLEITTAVNTPITIRHILHAWYHERAQIYFARRLQRLVEPIGWLEHCPDFKLVNMQKQWGSCSPQGVLHLNPWLIRAPSDCIDYVITHELCHLRERNHSKYFYLLLNRYFPNWEHVKARLDGMAELLLCE